MGFSSEPNKAERTSWPETRRWLAEGGRLGGTPAPAVFLSGLRATRPGLRPEEPHPDGRRVVERPARGVPLGSGAPALSRAWDLDDAVPPASCPFCEGKAGPGRSLLCGTSACRGFTGERPSDTRRGPRPPLHRSAPALLRVDLAGLLNVYTRALFTLEFDTRVLMCGDVWQGLGARSPLLRAGHWLGGSSPWGWRSWAPQRQQLRRPRPREARVLQAWDSSPGSCGDTEAWSPAWALWLRHCLPGAPPARSAQGAQPTTQQACKAGPGADPAGQREEEEGALCPPGSGGGGPSACAHLDPHHCWGVGLGGAVSFSAEWWQQQCPSQ